MSAHSMRGKPTLAQVMTPFPHFVSPSDSLDKAKRVMREQKIRHLPVKQNGELAGVVTDRDIYLVQSYALDDEAAAALKVRDAWIPDPYVVDISAPLEDVLLEIADRHIGSALVTKHGALAGILTLTDACRSFGEALADWFPRSGGDVA